MPDVNGATLTGTHDASLVVLSVAIAIAASYTALDLAGRVRATEGMARRLWLGTAALAMGGGTWSMHFVAMLALSLPMPIAYAPGLTLLSLAIAVLVSGLGFAVMWRRGGRSSDLLPSGLLVGAGIAAMHYTGMAAMRMPAELHYDVPLVVLSVMVAIGAATVALWLARRAPAPPERAAAAVAMGLAIAGMHYTAVAAARWVPSGSAAMAGASGHGALGRETLALWVAAVTFLVLLIALIAALVDRHLAAQAGSQAEAALRDSEARLRIAGEAGDIGIWDRDLVADSSIYSDTLNRLHGLPPDAPGPRYEEWLARVHPEDRARADAAVRAGLASGSYEDEFRILRPGGEVRWIAARGISFRDAQGRPARFVGVSTDVTERRQAEAALREHSRRLEILSEAAAGLLAARTPEEALAPLFRSLSEEFGLDLSFSCAVAEGTEGLRLVSCIGVPEEAGAGLDRLAREDVVCGTVAKTRKPMHVAEVQASD
ncbi:MAG: PAS domain-containing protein, partial [Acetobacteraceae bacterium]|nr:PAS domain-containing protein [Acetobacteraceae bacterium]